MSLGNQFKTGVVLGTGAAINVEVGWIPDRVEVYNATDGDLITTGFTRDAMIAFTSGGTTEIEAGDVITGATSAATARVKRVILASGTWAGGDAAGMFIADAEDVTGTFQSENVNTPNGDNLGTVVAQVYHNVAVAAAAAAATGNAAMSPYKGSAGSASKGFTIGSTVSESAKYLRWSAWRDG